MSGEGTLTSGEVVVSGEEIPAAIIETAPVGDNSQNETVETAASADNSSSLGDI